MQRISIFSTKNDYEIKLVMEGKINVNDLTNSQRQYDVNILERIYLNDDIELQYQNLNLFKKNFIYIKLYILWSRFSDI